MAVHTTMYVCVYMFKGAICFPLLIGHHQATHNLYNTYKKGLHKLLLSLK